MGKVEVRRKKVEVKDRLFARLLDSPPHAAWFKI